MLKVGIEELGGKAVLFGVAGQEGAAQDGAGVELGFVAAAAVFVDESFIILFVVRAVLSLASAYWQRPCQRGGAEMQDSAAE